jgi:hypothetical protein
MSTSLAVARAVDLLVHDDLADPFTLAQARLYVADNDETLTQFAVLDEDENPYRLLMRTRHHRPLGAGCLVVTGWCAPMSDDEQVALADIVRPSEHPERQRVRVSVAITKDGIASVMRQSDDPHKVCEMPARGAGDLPDVLESWWLGTLQ